MRRSGMVDTAEGLDSHDHVCWAFDRLGEFQIRAAQFLADGLDGGQRVMYVGSGDPDRMVRDLASIEGFAAVLESGGAQVVSVETMYPGNAVIDPERQVAWYAAATEKALADGHTGLRVAADATSLVRTPEQLAAFARYEHLVDRYMVRHPFSAMCGYSRRLGDEHIAAIGCMHPLVHTAAASFQLYTSPDPDVSAALAGEVDLASRALFPWALRRAVLPLVDGAVVIDARNVAFIDLRGMLELSAAVRGAPAVLRAPAGGVVRTLADLLQLPGLQMQTT